jgi:hypothetical protein
MKTSKNNSIRLSKYKWFAYSVIIIATIFIFSDIVEWYINRNKFVLDLFQLPLYRRFLTDFYILLFGFGGYLLLKENNKSWVFIIIAMTSIVPSFIIILLVWKISYSTNWLADFPFFLWHIFSLVVIIFIIVLRKDFGINYWLGKTTLIISINIGIRFLHEILIFYFIKT